MKLTIKPSKPYPVCYVESELGSDYFTPNDATSLVGNYYHVERIRRESLQGLKAKLHAYADSLTVDDLEIT